MKKYTLFLIIIFNLLLVANIIAAIYDQFNFLVPLLLGGLLFLMLKGWTFIRPISRAKTINYYLLIFSIIFALILGEFFLRSHGKYYTHYENKHNEWRSNFQTPLKDKGYLHIWPAHTRVVDTSISEFSYPHMANSLGLIGPEPAIKKKEGTYRIIGLGDSFTQGIGAPADSTWLKQMAAILNADTSLQPVYTLNAGVAGSDPFFEFQLLKKLGAYEADLVIMAANKSDMEDFFIRGAWERFKADGTTQYKAAPWYEPIYRISHLTRLIVHRILKKDAWFRSPGAEAAFETKFLDLLEEVVLKTQALCKQRQMDFILVFHPTLNEFTHQSSPYGALVQRLSQKGVVVFDLYPTFLEKNWITNETYESYFWKIDGHYNPRGYHYMGRGIAEKIQQLKLIPPKKDAFIE